MRSEVRLQRGYLGIQFSDASLGGFFPVNVVIANWFYRLRARAFSISQLGGAIGGLLGLLLCEVLRPLVALLGVALSPLRWSRQVKGALVVLALALTVGSAFLPKPEVQGVAKVGHAPAEPFSTVRLTALRDEGRPVLVDMTAAWCVTCKVNERLVFSTQAFADAAKDTGTIYMVGDWTNQDAEITRYLELFGRSGVPLYVFYPAGGGEPVVLPQLLNTKDVVAQLKAKP